MRFPAALFGFVFVLILYSFLPLGSLFRALDLGIIVLVVLPILVVLPPAAATLGWWLGAKLDHAEDARRFEELSECEDD